MFPKFRQISKNLFRAVTLANQKLLAQEPLRENERGISIVLARLLQSEYLIKGR